MSYTDADLVVAVPMLGRPHRVRPLLESLDDTVPGALVVFGCNPEDRQVIRAVEAFHRRVVLVNRQQLGDYARKVNTIVAETQQPLIFTAADDLLFHPGWFEAACAALVPGIGVVGTNDLGSPRVMAGEHSTHFLVTREYVNNHGTIDGPGRAMTEAYPHEYVDDEMVGTAKMRGAWAFAADSHVEHLHPNWGKAPMDGSYAQQQRRMIRGRRTYLTRRRRWT